jgi:hypothetical protein
MSARCSLSIRIYGKNCTRIFHSNHACYVFCPSSSYRALYFAGNFCYRDTSSPFHSVFGHCRISHYDRLTSLKLLTILRHEYKVLGGSNMRICSSS